MSKAKALVFRFSGLGFRVFGRSGNNKGLIGFRVSGFIASGLGLGFRIHAGQH